MEQYSDFAMHGNARGVSAFASNTELILGGA